MKRKRSPHRSHFFVGVARFELATLCSQSRYANRTALHPDDLSVLCEGKGSHFIQITKRPHAGVRFYPVKLKCITPAQVAHSSGKSLIPILVMPNTDIRLH